MIKQTKQNLKDLSFVNLTEFIFFFHNKVKIGFLWKSNKEKFFTYSGIVIIILVNIVVEKFGMIDNVIE